MGKILDAGWNLRGGWKVERTTLGRDLKNQERDIGKNGSGNIKLELTQLPVEKIIPF